MVVCLKNIDIEGPGTLGDFLRENNFEIEEIDLSKQERLPGDLTGIDAVLCMGGPMNVYEEDKYPFLAAEDAFLKEVIRAEIPLLGICLGSQLIAKTLGARVRKSPVKEVGIKDVFLTAKGAADPLFQGVKDPLPVFQWHEDTFDIPAGATLLATGRDCPHQAFRIGTAAYGIQFHVEITHVDVDMWARAYMNAKAPDFEARKEALISDYFDHEGAFRTQALTLYENFVGLIRARSKV